MEKNDAEMQSIAAALWDGGWRADDLDQLISEYNLKEGDAVAICELLAAFAGEAL